MLHDDDVVLHQQSLLAGDVDVQVRIVLVEVVEGDTSEGTHCLDEPAMDPRFSSAGWAKRIRTLRFGTRTV